MLCAFVEFPVGRLVQGRLPKYGHKVAPPLSSFNLQLGKSLETTCALMFFTLQICEAYAHTEIPIIVGPRRPLEAGWLASRLGWATIGPAGAFVARLGDKSRIIYSRKDASSRGDVRPPWHQVCVWQRVFGTCHTPCLRKRHRVFRCGGS